MQLANFVRILLVTLGLAGYAAWSRSGTEPRGEELRSPSVPAADGIPLLRLDQAHTLWRDPRTIFVDVRPATDYDVGHIRGAVHLPDEEFDARFATLQSRLEGASAIVVYCKSPDCGKSLWVAIRLRQAGLTQTRIYPAGWNEWDLHRYPATKAER